VPLVVLATRPGEPVALAQLAAAALAVLAGALWRGAWPQLWNGLGLVLTVVLLTWLGQGHRLRWRRPGLMLSLLTVLALATAVVYGAPLIGNTRQVEDITNGVSHYPMQASLGLAVAGVVAVAAITCNRLPAWTAAITACWLGVESVIYPDLPASLGTTGGALAAGWGCLVVTTVEVTRHSRCRRSIGGTSTRGAARTERTGAR
jgi:hypothetical protein